jgi:hypothetical protein
MSIIVLDVICGDKRINQFMHYGDVFESGKQYGEYAEITIEGEPNLDKLPENIRTSLEAVGQDVLFVSIATIDGIAPKKDYIFFKPGIQTISLGKKYSLFKDVLSVLGYNSITDKQMYVIKISKHP